MNPIEDRRNGLERRQVGGTHYDTPYGHWDLVWDAGMGYFDSQITRYVVRWRLKDGLKDLKKALHFCEKYIHLLDGATVVRPVASKVENALRLYFAANPQVGAPGSPERTVVELLARTHDVESVRMSELQIQQLIHAIEHAAEPGAGYVNQAQGESP